MSLFQCERCGCVENTATSCCGYYYGLILSEEQLCSFCYTGKWHGKFMRRFLPKGEYETGKDGNLVHKTTKEPPGLYSGFEYT